MTKVSTEKIAFDGSEKREYTLIFDINVDKEGLFSTTLPKDCVEMLEAVGFELRQNRLKNKGYFSDNTRDGLIRQVKNFVQDYFTKKLESETLVLSYVIETRASYCLDLKGNPVPNGRYEWVGTEEYKWKNGTVVADACNPTPFGLLFFIEPRLKRVYKFKSGKNKTEYHPVPESLQEKSTALHFLCSICSHTEPKNSRVEEVIYTESAGEFFVNMFKSVCIMNEQIKEFSKPEQLQKLIDNQSKIKLLG